jgi:hypothetical protein
MKKLKKEVASMRPQYILSSMVEQIEIQGETICRTHGHAAKVTKMVIWVIWCLTGQSYLWHWSYGSYGFLTAQSFLRLGHMGQMVS